ncbi:methyltransferase type 11 [Rhodomicrobium udaipurense JA643]|uniref:Class I SAM-dependent methyltransferase n=1 Tax=Rhodomicrobium udaipurense TaxID=1202716 RepID=A0A8I1GEA8_9HYPH|nr:class I SAM-dependent methyltransferase [Rhodomicrobium udaipurense]KAI94539.1 methyltransferase type 11 [Rhodomicrobium udaipurense JA643]MBJ7544395.1 class I SAM-dependent methyltransferase [Rhodomicrobium udaipurense]
MKQALRTRRPLKPDYGIDKPKALARLFLAGIAALAAGYLLPSYDAPTMTAPLLAPTLLALGCLSLGACALMLAWSFKGKFVVRDRMLKLVRWRGNETVLDLGTGRGLLAIGAAGRLKTGTVVGIDAWESERAAATIEEAQRNLDLAGVADRVELRNDDPRDIGFVDKSFDVVLSLSFLHTLDTEAARAAVCREIARVLRPRGLVAIADVGHGAEYAKALEAAGLKVDKPRTLYPLVFTALELVIARKTA